VIVVAKARAADDAGKGLVIGTTEHAEYALFGLFGPAGERISAYATTI
jgi:hypothetical protein